MITATNIKANGLVDLWDRIEEKFVEMAPIDANHALQSDTEERWCLEKPQPAAEPAPAPEIDKEDEDDA